MILAPLCRSVLIATALGAAPPPAPQLPPPAAAGERCGSCHALPPATGAHAKHARKRVGCGECHGPRYRGGTDPALHQNGATDVAARAGWNPTSRGCANECHGRETWGRVRPNAPGAGVPARIPGDAGGRESDGDGGGRSEGHDHDRDRDDDHDRDHDHQRDRDHGEHRDRDRDHD